MQSDISNFTDEQLQTELNRRKKLKLKLTTNYYEFYHQTFFDKLDAVVLKIKDIKHDEEEKFLITKEDCKLLIDLFSAVYDIELSSLE